MKYKLMTKDQQWSMSGWMTEQEIVRVWNGLRGTVVLDRVIVGEDDKQYVVVDGFELEEKTPYN